MTARVATVRGELTLKLDDGKTVTLGHLEIETLHDAYEAAALTEGWETQERSRKPWSEVPSANQATMRAAVAALLKHLSSGQSEADRLAQVRAYVDDPGNWSGRDGRRDTLLALIDGKEPTHD